MVKFSRYYATDGQVKARVHYSTTTLTDGRKCVTLYGKDYSHNLGKIFGSKYQNDTDLMTDYFDEGRVRIFEGDELYPAALERAQMKYERKEASAAKFVRKDVNTVATNRGSTEYTVVRKTVLGKTWFMVYVVNASSRAWRKGFSAGRSFWTLGQVEAAYKGLKGIAEFFAQKPRARIVEGALQIVDQQAA